MIPRVISTDAAATDAAAHLAPDDAQAADLVVLLSEEGASIGTADRIGVHGDDTPLHLAFSSYLFDDEGRLLLTRRALSKVTWPGVWSNSACGHPRPGEEVSQAVARRVTEELGATPRDLRVALPDYRYRAVDVSGVVENEICPVFVGRLDPSELDPDPSEIAEATWVPWPEVVRLAATAPALISPWAAEQIRLLAEAIPADSSTST